MPQPYRRTLTLAAALCLSAWAALAAQEAGVREHSEIIDSPGAGEFVIEVGGTIDPENLEITIENVGDAPVVNPRVTVNGKFNWSTIEDMVAEITRGCATEKEKAMAIFDFVEKQSYWWSYPKDRTSLNPVRHFNVYGYHICSQAACEFVALCRAAGLQARVYEIWHHTVSEAFWDGAWHHMDPDIGLWYLKKDNLEVASIAELEADPALVARSYKPYRWYLTPGDNRKMIYLPDKELAGEGLAGIYATADDNYIETNYDEFLYKTQTMDYALRPGEKLVRWWRPVLHKRFDMNSSHEHPRYANGQWTFEPDFRRFDYAGMVQTRNLKFFAQDGRLPAVHVDRLQDRDHDRGSELEIAIKSPYVIVGGYVETSYYKGGTAGLDRVACSAELDPMPWGRSTSLWEYYSWAYGPGECRAVLDEKIDKDGGPLGLYDLTVSYDISADARGKDTPQAFPLVYGGQSGLDRVKIVADLQVNPGSLPALSLGRNVVKYVDQSGQGRRVKITYRWRERSDQHAPAAPARALAPAAGAKAGLAPKFVWEAARDADGDAIVNYRFQLSTRPDCAWPLCASFDRDVRTGESFQAPQGFLNPGATYYWRVRAEDAQGNFGPWSEVFSFKAGK